MFFPRHIYPQLREHLKKPEITVLTGMRRTGKTFILRRLYEEIPANKVFFDLKNRVNRDFFSLSDYEEIKSRLILNYGLDAKKKIFVFLDEIQNLPKIPSIAKYLSDHYKMKFVMTSTLNFNFEIFFELYPLTFEEFLVFKNKKSQLSSIPDKNWPKIKKFDADGQNYGELFREYLQFGGFPGVVLQQQKKEKEIALKDILYSYIEQDVQKLTDFSKIEALENLIKLLAERVGQKVEVARLSSETGLARPTIDEYLEFLEKTYLISRVSPFTSSWGREISKTKKLYFCDSGLANILSPNSAGQLLENAIYNTLRVKYNFTRAFGAINYYQREDGAEIDFVVDKNLAIEVKTTASDFDAHYLNLAVQKLKIPRSMVVSQNFTPAKNIVYATSL